MKAKDLKEKLNNIPDDTSLIAVMGKEGFDGDVIDVKYDESGRVVLEVNI